MVRQQIHKVDKPRSAEQWATLTSGKEDCKWHSPSKRRFIQDISGEWVLYTPTGSVFDGLKEYLLLTHFLPAEPLPSKTEDILFASQVQVFHATSLRLLNPRGWHNLAHRGWPSFPRGLQDPNARPRKLC
ncbi:unnamed protein product [Symbiodinium necroappetens]|uniref:Uncharacterized protein n=1 Tax=Symbiodinium necroappetens TaxID=1628268 RepID=A0A812SD74_9DINO|nr:unnamed protein product [Symbiodinium necroappetens]